MKTITVTTQRQPLHPKKLLLWVALGSITMMFVAFTSAYIVRKYAGNWTEFNMPLIFLFNTILIIFSSWTMHKSFVSLKKKFLTSFQFWLGITTLLGILFVVLQYFGWKQLNDIGIYLNGNPSGSFLFVISGVHAFHVVGGVLFLVTLYLNAIFNLRQPVKRLIYETNQDNLLNINLMETYWHFVGGLWVYLYLFFYFNQL